MSVSQKAKQPDGSIKECVWMEGPIKKRSGRMSPWSNRYLVLVGTRLEYRLSESSPDVRGTFDLIPGCRVTEVINEGKEQTFWIVWPREASDSPSSGETDDPSTLSDEQVIAASSAADAPNKRSLNAVPPEKKLTGDGRTTQLLSQQQHQQQLCLQEREHVEKQIALYQSHDNSISFITKVAAAVSGSVVVGVLTAGVGVLPLLALAAGGLAVAGGSSYHRHPSNSRLIIACESRQEAQKWKRALEEVIASLEKRRGPKMPAAVDARLVSTLARLGCDFNHNSGRWEYCNTLGNAIFTWKLIKPPAGFQCRRAHAVIRATPLEAFLALIESPPWPTGGGSMHVVQVLDSNSDIISVELKTNISPQRLVCRRLYLTRFWRMTEDGSYFISLNGISAAAVATSLEGRAQGFLEDGVRSTEECFGSSHTQPVFNALITLAPRKDHILYEYDIPEVLVTCAVQVSCGELEYSATNALRGNPVSGSKWLLGESDAVLLDMLRGCIADLNDALALLKFDKTSITRVSASDTNPPEVKNLPTIASKSDVEHFATDRTKQILDCSDLGPNIEVAKAFTAGARSKIMQRLRKDDSYNSSFTMERPSDINSHASSLRAKIATKEYELLRLHTVSYSSSSAISVQEANTLQPLLELELDELKSQYMVQTGRPYDEVASRRAALSRHLPAERVTATDRQYSDKAQRNDIDFFISQRSIPPFWCSGEYIKPTALGLTGVAIFFGLILSVFAFPSSRFDSTNANITTLE